MLSEKDTHHGYYSTNKDARLFANHTPHFDTHVSVLWLLLPSLYCHASLA